MRLETQKNGLLAGNPEFTSSTTPWRVMIIRNKDSPTIRVLRGIRVNNNSLIPSTVQNSSSSHGVVLNSFTLLLTFALLTLSLAYTHTLKSRFALAPVTCNQTFLYVRLTKHGLENAKIIIISKPFFLSIIMFLFHFQHQQKKAHTRGKKVTLSPYYFGKLWSLLITTFILTLLQIKAFLTTEQTSKLSIWPHH